MRNAFFGVLLLMAGGLFVTSARGDLLSSGTAGCIADTFVTSGTAFNASPTANYGGAGALVVAGSNSSNGEFQSVLRFDLEYIKTFYDAKFGIGNWFVTQLTLTLSSNAAFQGQKPNNPIFPTINAGDFAIDWMTDNNWGEGPATANPSMPYLSANPPLDGVTFDSLPLLLTPSDKVLGNYHWAAPSGMVVTPPFSQDGSGGQVSTDWTLSNQPDFVADIESGGIVSLRLYSTDNSTAYLFNSRSKQGYEPMLTVIAVPEPTAFLYAALGLLLIVISKSQLKASRAREFCRSAPKSAGFTLIELLIVIALISVLTTLAGGALAQMRARAASAECVDHLRQWGMALHLYCADNDGMLPRRGQGVQPVFLIDRPEDWFNALPPYLGMEPYSQQVSEGHPAKPGDHSLFVCPSAQQTANYPHFLCYGMNMYLSPWIRPQPNYLVELPKPSQLAFMADAPGGWASTIPSRGPYSVQARHYGRANVAFVDGHVESLNGAYIGCGTGEPTRPDIRWQTLTAGINQTPLP